MEPRVGNRYRLGRKLGSGSFGEIYLGTNIQTNQAVAMKLESVKTKNPQLQCESKLYRILQGGEGIAYTKWFGIKGDYNVLVMNMLGPSLEELFNYCSRKFSLKTVLMLAEQMITRVEHVHSKSFLHRDIKPDNFVMGVGQHHSQGKQKPYWNCKICEHEYSPRNRVKSQGRSRVARICPDVFLERKENCLPWQGIKAGNKKQKNEKISEKKVSTSIEAIMLRLPLRVRFILPLLSVAEI